MKQLLKYELLKIFKQKSIYLIGILLLILIFMVIQHYPKTNPQFYKPYEGVVTQEKINEVTKENKALSQHQNLTANNLAKLGVLEEFSWERYAQSHNQQLIKLLGKHHTKEAKIERSMLKHLKLNTFYNDQAPIQTINFNSSFGVWVSGVLILVGLSSIFTKEYTTGVDQFIFASKLGRKSLVTAKLVASMIYTLIVVLIWVIYDAIHYFIVLGNSGWHSPIQFNPLFDGTPYPFSMIEFLILGVFIHLIGALGFTILVLVVSALCNKLLTSFLISGIIFGLPVILSNFPNPFKWLTDFSYTNIMESKSLFNKFNAYNVFGLAILQPIMVISVSALISLVLIWLTYRFVKRKGLKA
jgi:hypothetical protein